MTRRLLTLIGGSLAFWLLLAVPARHAWGDPAVIYSATALGLCLIPAAVTFAAASWAKRQSPEQQAVIVLAGTGVRLLTAGGGALAVTQFVPYFRGEPGPGFLVWVMVFYIFTLVLETALTVTDRPATAGTIGPAVPTPPADRVG